MALHKCGSSERFQIEASFHTEDSTMVDYENTELADIIVSYENEKRNERTTHRLKKTLYVKRLTPSHKLFRHLDHSLVGNPKSQRAVIGMVSTDFGHQGEYAKYNRL